MRLYSPQTFRGGVVYLIKRGKSGLLLSVDESKDRRWMERSVSVRTSEIIPDNRLPFPEAWNMNPNKREAECRGTSSSMSSAHS
ncbi:hypothetical protein CQW23_09406 [Capsicum baccatum]|uniref:Uncharacterized protein n=1 Tax=Capsicum baccatum TaxID=33114 RepID=A0A2G2WWW3_CAPBA|nr:hypothetical protein CQW23_09406 [Capsicum baccatum]